MTTEEIATKYNTNENVKDHQNSILEVLAQRIPQTIDPLSTVDSYTLVKQTSMYRSCDKAILPDRETIRSMQHSIS